MPKTGRMMLTTMCKAARGPVRSGAVGAIMASAGRAHHRPGAGRGRSSRATPKIAPMTRAAPAICTGARLSPRMSSASAVVVIGSPFMMIEARDPPVKASAL